MSHSMIAADRRAHCALAAAVSLITLANAAWRADVDALNAQAPSNGFVLEAGKPTISATIRAPVIR